MMLVGMNFNKSLPQSYSRKRFQFSIPQLKHFTTNICFSAIRFSFLFILFILREKSNFLESRWSWSETEASESLKCISWTHETIECGTDELKAKLYLVVSLHAYLNLVSIDS